MMGRDLEQRLRLAQRNLLQRRRSELTLLESRLQAHSPLPYLRQQQLDLARHRQRLISAMQQKLQHAGEHLGHLAQMLDSLSPLGTLQRGYAIVTDTSGQVVRNVGEVSVGDEVEARLAKGRLGLTVSKVKKR